MRLPVPITGRIRFENGHLIDERGRPLRDLRISLTDHCNFRCRYCMPKEKFDSKHQFLAHTELLSFEEIKRLVGIFLRFGVQKIRLTGGEPLLRKHVCNLIADLKSMRTTSGKSPDIAMTTNGTLLKRMAADLKAAGLDRVTVSLDALNEDLFQSINDVGFPAAKVIESIEAAQALGIPVKINTVVKRGMNEGEIIPILERFRNTGVIVRFIEYMDAGTANGWRMDDVVPSAELVERINAVWTIEPIDPNYTGETATRWRYKDGAGEIGFISSVTLSARTAPACAFRSKAASCCASLPIVVTTSERCYAAARRMMKLPTRLRVFGARETTTTQKFVCRKRKSAAAAE